MAHSGFWLWYTTDRNQSTVMSNDVKIFGGIIGATIILIICAVFFLGRGGETAQTQSQAKPTVVPMTELVKEDSWALGTPSAKVTLVEFGDFQCPTCKEYEPTVEAVVKKYGDKIYFVYRHFPITQAHQFALSSADAAEAAGMQGKFWEYHNKLFQISPNLDKDNLLKVAKELKLDEAKFSSDLGSDAARQRVLNDMESANKVGVNGTPTFFINGKQYSLSELQTVKDFQSKIDPLLK